MCGGSKHHFCAFWYNWVSKYVNYYIFSQLDNDICPFWFWNGIYSTINLQVTLPRISEASSYWVSSFLLFLCSRGMELPSVFSKSNCYKWFYNESYNSSIHTIEVRWHAVLLTLAVGKLLLKLLRSRKSGQQFSKEGESVASGAKIEHAIFPLGAGPSSCVCFVLS